MHNNLPPIIVDMLRIVRDPKADINHRDNVARTLSEIVDIASDVLDKFGAERNQYFSRRIRKNKKW